MGALNRQLHMEGVYEHEDAEGAIKTFLPAFVENPEALTQQFAEFERQLYVDVTTPAHEAISHIIDAKQGSIIITENVDLKHEAEGSRHDAVHLDSSLETFDLVKKRAEKAQVLITVGLSADDRSVIAYLKEKNPQLKIMAFALPPRHEKDIPSFLQGDYAIFGDCQQLLPKLADEL